MTSNLFQGIGRRVDKTSIVMNALNDFNDSYFPKFVKSLIVDKEGGGGEHAGCRFAKALDESELYHDYAGVPFEGVECWSLDDEVIVSEEEFYKILKMACDRYIEIHPEKRDELEQIMSQLTPV